MEQELITKGNGGSNLGMIAAPRNEMDWSRETLVLEITTPSEGMNTKEYCRGYNPSAVQERREVGKAGR